MKFHDVVARLAIALGEEVSDFAESFRVLRLMVPEADDGRTFDWAGGATLKTLFRTRAGPGGGVASNAATVGFVLTALMVDSSRREIAHRAMDIQFALAPMTPRGKRWVRMTCPRTGEKFFGGALAKCLSDRALFDDLAAVEVSTKLSTAFLLFNSDIEEWRQTRIIGKGSPLFTSERAKISVEDIGLQRTAVLNMDKVRFLYDAIHHTEQVAAMT